MCFFAADAGRGPNQADILNRLDPAPLNHILQRYEEYLRNAATRVAADQGIINRNGERDFARLYHLFNTPLFQTRHFS